MTPEFPMKIRSLVAATAACAFACSAFAADAPDKAKPAPPAHPNGPDAAAADVAKMTVPAGLQSTLFASEPMVGALSQARGLKTISGDHCRGCAHDPVALSLDVHLLAMTSHDYQRAWSAVGARNSQPLKVTGP